jgi:hypothetical protein
MDDLHALADSVREGQTILFLGQGVSCDYGDPGAELRLFNSIAAEIGSNAIELHQKDGLFILKNCSKRNVLSKLKPFYEQDFSNPLLQKIAEIPFHLYMVTTPDKSLENIFMQRNLLCKTDFYELCKEEIPAASAAAPLIYNLFGSVKGDARKNLFVDHFDLFEYVKAVYTPDSSLPDTLMSYFTKSKTDNIIFLGCNFDKWYFQLILHLLRIVDIESCKSLEGEPGEGEWRSIYKNGFRISFVNENPEAFIDRLHGCFNENELRKALPDNENNIEQFKEELLRLIDEGESYRVFSKIKKSNFKYEALNFNRLQSELAFGGSYETYQRLKVFVESISYSI